MARLLRQAGALAYLRRKGVLQVLLITSRDTGRWVIPKGGIERGFSARAAAAQEALEEAGITGFLASKVLGIYTYDKMLRSGRKVPAVVKVFPMRVEKQLKKWAERGQRQAEWMPPEAAAAAVQEPELAALIRRLDEFVLAEPKKKKDRAGKPGAVEMPDQDAVTEQA
jgi:8-oxo-dGTP pyrophosphatase MutT (NUDIX family)